MSKTTTRKFKCMKCDEVYDIETFDSVNVTLDPDLKDKVSSGDIFYKECPHCHNTYMLEYPCLYHDMERKFMVWLMKEEIDANIKNMYTQVFNEQKQLTLRRCEDIKSFLEKIEIFNNGLDDRAIEIKIIQIDSQSSRSADELLQRSKQSGDLYDIVENLKNLCDYSCESSYENVNILSA